MKLNNKNIDATIKDIQNFFAAAGVDKKDILKLCLILEDSLIQYQKIFGADKEFTLHKKKWFGTPKIIIRVKEKPFNPLQNEDENSLFSRAVMENLLNYETAGTVYKYEYGFNEISSFSTVKRKPLKIPGGIMTTTILAAIFCSIAVKFLPATWQIFIVETLTPFLLNMIKNAIVAAMGPFTFISIVAGILAIDNVDTLSNVGLKIIRRFFLITFVTSIIAAAVAQIFYPVVTLESSGEVSSGKIENLLLNIVPKNIFSPFIEGNILQVVIIAAIVGVVIVLTGDKVPALKKIALESKVMIFKIMDAISKIMIAIIFFSVFKTLMTTSLESVLEIWQIVAINYITFAIICGVMLMNIYLRYKVDVGKFFKALSKVLITAFSTGSTTVVMLENLNVAVKNFKVSEKFCSFWIPLSHALCTPTKSAALVVAVFYSAKMSGVEISPFAFAVLIFLALQLALAAPPGPGGTIPIYIMMLEQFGLSVDTIGALAMADVFTINLSSAVLMITKDCELIDIAHQLNYIEKG